MKVVCINDAHRPNEVPLSRWIKRNETYTVVKVVNIRQQPGVLGFKLAERDNDDLFPYTYFRADRFAPLADQPERTEKEAEVLEEELA